MKKIVSVLLFVFLLVNSSVAFAATSNAPSKAQLGALSKYMAAVEGGNVAAVKGMMHSSVKLNATSSESLSEIKDFIENEEGYIKHFNMTITKYGNATKKLGQGFKLKGYLLTASPEFYMVAEYTVFVYLLNSKGVPKLVTEKPGESKLIEDFDTLPQKVQTKANELLMDHYGEDYFENLAGAEEEEEEIDIDFEEDNNSDAAQDGTSDVSGDYLTAEDLIDLSQLTYEDLKYGANKFVNSDGSHFSQIVLSDTNATEVSFKFANTGTADIYVNTTGSSEEEIKVNAKSTKVLTFSSNPEDSHLFIIRFDKSFDTDKSSDGDIRFTLSDLKVYTD